MKTLKNIQINFEKAGLNKLFDEMKRYAKNSINIFTAIERNHNVGGSRFGGDPDLPPELEWFKNDISGAPLNFIGQINCAEITSFDIDKKLPSNGILYFFYDIEAFLWGFDKSDCVGSKVYYYEGPTNNLSIRPCPNEIKKFTPCSLTFKNQIDLPEYSSQLIQEKLSEEEYEKYLDLQDSLELEVDYKLLGHSNNIQNGMELQCELVRQGIYCGSNAAYQDPRTSEFLSDSYKWNLLLQITSNNMTDMKFGDEGALYFWIREDDLKARRFDCAWQILQSY
ncbi:YwqG family protein [Taylorella equigenitalis]|uniref:YwqG family protein n=1 Tax=Taylorella equigenitalis TaxID=29575 RepID=UPI000427042A|nr:YwqG family protein [Taylorella equigenitalis]WDU45843.1 DUF1963 domain-containing protein [Taylorella equigenitalis]